MFKIGIFGGTFNPIHNGHLYLSKCVSNILNLDKVIVLPANIPPHKAWLNITDSYHRYEMCRLAYEDNPLFKISDFEVSKKGSSYTIDTLNYFLHEYKNCKMYLIMGADSFCSVMKWYKFEEIIKNATLCTAPRDKYSIEKLNEIDKILKSIGAETKVLNIPIFPLSSTLIRKNIYTNNKIDDLVPEKVAEYIRRNNLFREME